MVLLYVSADHLTLMPVHEDFLNQEQLDQDSMGYPKLPSSMSGGVTGSKFADFLQQSCTTNNYSTVYFSRWHDFG
jgi:hypothetical protein